MASIRVDSYIDIGTGGIHDATSWQFAKDPEFTKIIDQSLKDKKNVKEWHSMLPKLEEDKTDPDAEEYYSELDEIYARVKIHLGDTESEWFVIGPKSQRHQRVQVIDSTAEVEEGELPEYMTDSTTLGWTEEVFDPEDPEILGPVIPVPEDTEEEEEEEEEQLAVPEEEAEGSGSGDPFIPELLPDGDLPPEPVPEVDTDGSTSTEPETEGVSPPAEQEFPTTPGQQDQEQPPTVTEPSDSESVEPEPEQPGQTEDTESKEEPQGETEQTEQLPEDSSTDTPPIIEDTGTTHPGDSESEHSMGTAPVQPESTEDSEKNQ